MTAKRYKRHLSFVLDDCANGSDRLMTIREVIPRLNELYEENEQLKQRINVLNDQITAQAIVIEGYQNRNQKLFDEKEQLQKELDQFYGGF